MEAYYSLHSLVLFLVLSQLSSAQNPTEKSKLVPLVKETEFLVKQAPNQPVETQQKNQENPSAKVEPGNPQLATTEDTKHKNKCRSTEVLTVNKGCVDRNEYMQSVMQRAWDDENMDAAKDAAGLARSIECAENEIRTPVGCGPAPKSEEEARVPIVAAVLYKNKVYPGADGIPETDNSKEPLEIQQRCSSCPPSVDPHAGGGGKIEIGRQTEDRIIGHNRPRYYVYLPGRLLQSKRKCRPYEVLGKNGRCLRKKGKVGFYKHKDHRYGNQRRHRHEAFQKE